MEEWGFPNGVTRTRRRFLFILSRQTVVVWFRIIFRSTKRSDIGKSVTPTNPTSTLNGFEGLGRLSVLTRRSEE